jgi:hypothetical protein
MRLNAPASSTHKQADRRAARVRPLHAPTNRLAVVLAATAAIAVLCSLAGCGSSPSYADDARSAVKTMVSTLQHYDSARPADVASTGAACKSALDGLKGDTKLADQNPPVQYKQLGLALRHAYTSARAGFTDCTAGASAFDYVTMARASGEIADANGWIAQAKSLDH